MGVPEKAGFPELWQGKAGKLMSSALTLMGQETLGICPPRPRHHEGKEVPSLWESVRSVLIVKWVRLGIHPV